MELNDLTQKIKINIFIIVYSYISCAIIIPYQTYNPLLTKNETLLELIKNSSDQSIVETMSRNLIYTEFNVGENIQTVPTFIEMQTKEFIIKDISIHNINDNMKIKNSNFSFISNYLLKPIFKNKYYNSKYSNSYKFVENCYDFIIEYLSIVNACANESIYMIKKRISMIQQRLRILIFILDSKN